MVTKGLMIGKIAKLARVNVETIRYYQRRGLLTEPDKPHMGYRRYPVDSVRHIRFIKRAQQLGFTLNEAGKLLRMEDARACAEARSMALRKMALIDHKLTELMAMRTALASLVPQCETGSRAKGCPILKVLTQE